MPAGIGEHSDITEAVIAELDKLASAHDRLEMINKYFPTKEEKLPLFENNFDITTQKLYNGYKW